MPLPWVLGVAGLGRPCENRGLQGSGRAPALAREACSYVTHTGVPWLAFLPYLPSWWVVVSIF